MFDLAFHKVVRQVLTWTEDAPGLQIMNLSQAKMLRNKEKTEAHRLKRIWLADEMDLREYVSDTYIDYFSLTMRIGPFQENVGKIFFSELD